MFIKSPFTELANARQNSLPLVAEDGSYVNLIGCTPGQDDAHQAPGRQLAAKQPCMLGLPGGRNALTNTALAALERYRMGQPDPRQLIDVLRFNVFYAFAHNAKVLGFNDDWLKYEAISPFGAPRPSPPSQPIAASCPPNMKPTMLQMTVEHHPWIDFLPCPRMRDNFLRLVRDMGEDAVDEDGLCVDIVDAASARGPEDVCLVTWGKPWELSGWEVTEPFMKKWAWLLEGCTELMESTNTWRRKRGLHDLHFVH
ncbi:hypothetical protein DL770_009180 [Monosporascus sp. CRB-9-2]|nr:hypothetical protein DL770_009180 [Monosporascus sp. CRB-9-2]